VHAIGFSEGYTIADPQWSGRPPRIVGSA
jgi:hypothetical protein